VVPLWFCLPARGKIDFSYPHSSFYSQVVRPWRPAMRRRVRSLQRRVAMGSEARISPHTPRSCSPKPYPLPFLSSLSLPWCGGGHRRSPRLGMEREAGSAWPTTPASSSLPFFFPLLKILAAAMVVSPRRRHCCGTWRPPLSGTIRHSSERTSSALVLLLHR
jgi:hypothetical protein